MSGRGEMRLVCVEALEGAVPRSKGKGTRGACGKSCEVLCEDVKGVSPVDLDSASGLQSLADAQ